MKKYVKPVLYYEQFELSQNIAACGFDMNYSDPNTCVAVGDKDFNNQGFNIFYDHCDHPIGESDGFLVCYEVSVDAPDYMKIYMS